MVQGFTTIPIKHPLLDGNLDSDTIVGTPQQGDLITASGAGFWNRYGIGQKGYVLTSLGLTVGWQAPFSHPLLDGNIDADTIAASPLAGDLITASGAGYWSRYPIGAVGNVLTVSPGNLAAWLPPTGGAHPLLDGNIDADTIAGTPIAGDLIYASGASPKWQRQGIGSVGQFFQVSSAGLPWFQPLPFVAVGNMYNPASGANIMVFQTQWPCTLTALQGFQDTSSGAFQFTARRIIGTSVNPSYLYLLPSGAITRYVNQWTPAGPVINNSFSVGDSLEVCPGSGAWYGQGAINAPNQFAILASFTRP